MDSQIKPFYHAILLIIAAALFITVSARDYDDAVIAENQYCDDVNNLNWVNYQNLDCGNNDEREQKFTKHLSAN